MQDGNAGWRGSTDKACGATLPLIAPVHSSHAAIARKMAIMPQSIAVEPEYAYDESIAERPTMGNGRLIASAAVHAAGRRWMGARRTGVRRMSPHGLEWAREHAVRCGRRARRSSDRPLAHRRLKSTGHRLGWLLCSARLQPAIRKGEKRNLGRKLSGRDMKYVIPPKIAFLHAFFEVVWFDEEPAAGYDSGGSGGDQ